MKKNFNYSNTVIFCRECHVAQKSENVPECENCGKDLQNLDNIIVGKFKLEDAKLLQGRS